MPSQSCDFPKLLQLGTPNTILRIMKRNPDLFLQQEKIYSLSDSN